MGVDFVDGSDQVGLDIGRQAGQGAFHAGGAGDFSSQIRHDAVDAAAQGGLSGLSAIDFAGQVAAQAGFGSRCTRDFSGDRIVGAADLVAQVGFSRFSTVLFRGDLAVQHAFSRGGTAGFGGDVAGKLAFGSRCTADFGGQTRFQRRDASLEHVIDGDVVARVRRTGDGDEAVGTDDGAVGVVDDVDAVSVVEDDAVVGVGVERGAFGAEDEVARLGDLVVGAGGLGSDAAQVVGFTGGRATVDRADVLEGVGQRADGGLQLTVVDGIAGLRTGGDVDHLVGAGVDVAFEGDRAVQLDVARLDVGDAHAQGGELVQSVLDLRTGGDGLDDDGTASVQRAELQRLGRGVVPQATSRQGRRVSAQALSGQVFDEGIQGKGNAMELREGHEILLEEDKEMTSTGRLGTIKREQSHGDCSRRLGTRNRSARHQDPFW